MEIQLSRPTTIFASSSSASSNHNQNENPNSNNGNNSMQSWWESISKARSRIQTLSSILSALADSDRPARSLLESPDASLSISAALSSPYSGSGDDPLCHWFYDTFLSSDPDLCLVVLSFIPLLSGIYLSRVVSTGPAAPSLAASRPSSCHFTPPRSRLVPGSPPSFPSPTSPIPPSTTHPATSPLPSSPSRPLASSLPHLNPRVLSNQPSVLALSPLCSTATIRRSLMPSRSKIDFCEFATSWARQDCSCRDELDSASLDGSDGNSNSVTEIRILGDGDEIESVGDEMGRLGIGKCSPKRANGHCVETRASLRGSRIPLPWELFQAVLRILGHCHLAPLNPQVVRDAASVAAQCLYARALHDLIPQAILATRNLIQLDKKARAVAKEVAAANAALNPNTPSKPKKPEILLVSK